MGWINIDNAIGLRYCCAKGSSSTMAIPSSGAITQVPLDTWITCSDSSLFTFSNSGIKIAEAGTYLVSANIYYVCPSNSTRGVYIFSEEGMEMSSVRYTNQGVTPQGAVCLSPKILSLSANTTLILKGRQTGASNNGTIYPSNLGTYITIIKLS